MAQNDESRGPEIGGLSLGSVAGAVVGSIGGLFSVGIPPAIVFRDLQALFQTPKLGVICFVISGFLGWLIGGQVGPRVGRRFGNPWAEVVAGAVSGLLPVIMVLVWSYSMVT